VSVLRRLQTAPGAEIVLAAVGDEPGVHVVGGAVRDALLDRVPRELDLEVEGDALAVARRAAARVSGRLTAHERFGTATVQADGYVFDLAGARRERYARPGALPEVELGAPLAEDLGRRDFTVNAMAVRLSDGRLTAWPGAREDLAAGVLRVLHARSFEDDPTRLLRLARYGHRLGFAPDPETARLADPALMRTVSGDRLGNELRLILREGALGALDGLGRALLGDGFAVPDPLPADPLAALAASVRDVGDLDARLDALGFTARDRRLVTTAASLQLAGATDVELWQALRRVPAEAVELVAARAGPDAEAARRWLDDVRHRRLEITGADLVDAGLSGAAVGAGLEAATVAMLEGRAPDRDTQLAAALSL